MVGIGLIYSFYMLATKRSFTMPGEAIEPEKLSATPGHCQRLQSMPRCPKTGSTSGATAPAPRRPSRRIPCSHTHSDRGKVERMSKGYILAHDTGTGGDKAVLTDLQGRVVESAYQPYEGLLPAVRLG